MNDVHKMSSGCCVSDELCYNVCTLLCFHQTRTVWCYCSDKVYLYQLMVKSVIFYTLREWSALVNEMLRMMAGDVESNPGPREYLCCTITPKLTTYSTSSHMCDSEPLWYCSPTTFYYLNSVLLLPSNTLSPKTIAGYLTLGIENVHAQ